MSKPSKKTLKVVAVLVEVEKPYYLIRVYESGRLITTLKRFLKPEYIKRWFFYNQSLLEYKYVEIKERRNKKTISIAFDEAVSRHFKIFVFYLYSIVNLKSYRRVDCLARCWSRIDATSPVLDTLLELSRITESKRFSGLLRGYCLCR